MSELNRFVQGEDLSVDVTAIERSLSKIWRQESDDGTEPVTRAALWNVVAHTASDSDKNLATQTLGLASVSVPQRSIVIRSARSDDDELSSWIGANCHLVSGSRQVCSEEISIVAGGRRVSHVPSLVNALLIPDMPVAAWWLGDIPSGEDEYVAALLEPADRLVVDSVHFDSVDDLRLVRRVSEESKTTPADLNWVRMEAWRVATASMFDPADMRSLLGKIRSVRVISGSGSSYLFGEHVEALFFAAWLSSKAGHEVDSDGRLHGARGAVSYEFHEQRSSGRPGDLLYVEIGFEDGGSIMIEKNEHASAIIAKTRSLPQPASTVTLHQMRTESDLIVRQLAQRERDPVFFRILPRAVQLSGRL